MEYYYYDSTTKEFLYCKNQQLEIAGASSTTVEVPQLEHDAANFPNYIEKAVFDEESNTWTKVAL